MIRLSERLERLAGFVEPGQRVADIGTDHAYLPIYLKQADISPLIIAIDINPGPLEKMEQNLEKYLGANRSGIIVRQGDGMDVLEKGQVDTVVIAGMGGLLMVEILNRDLEKTRNLKKLILQPRNAPDKLRKWLLDTGFVIEDEALVREGKFIWEIIAAAPAIQGKKTVEREQYDIGYRLIEKKDPLLSEFLDRKIAVEEEVIKNTRYSNTESAHIQRDLSERKLESFRRIKENVNK